MVNEKVEIPKRAVLHDWLQVIEEIVAHVDNGLYQGTMTPHTRAMARSRVAWLLDHAKPGNWAEYELDKVWGLCPDWDVNDAGNERN